MVGDAPTPRFLEKETESNTSFQCGTNAQISAQFLINEGHNSLEAFSTCLMSLPAPWLQHFQQKEGDKHKAQLTGAPL